MIKFSLFKIYKKKIFHIQKNSKDTSEKNEEILKEYPTRI